VRTETQQEPELHCREDGSDICKDFNNRYPDWVPISYELRHENPLENPESKFAGMPNEANTKAWDDLIARLSPPPDSRTLS
jgi:hypothetical protein